MRFTSDITVKPIQSCGSDSTLAAAAKVLEPDAYEDYLKTHEKSNVGGLLHYLMQHRHGTPFEHSFMTFFVHAPIFVWREWHRHRIGFSYNEESARYKTLDPVFYIPPRDRPMMKVNGWKPGRPKFKTLDEARQDNELDFNADYTYNQIVDDMKAGYVTEYERYLRQLDRKLDPGLARDNLPVGIYSSCWVSCNPRSLMAFLSLRTHEQDAKMVSYPLYEIEVAARACEAVFAKGWPITYKAFCDYGRVAP
jgi:thymidylate synthase (FAD)